MIAWSRSTSGFHPQIVPSLVSKMNRAGADFPSFEITNSEVVLATSPVGEPSMPTGRWEQRESSRRWGGVCHEDRTGSNLDELKTQHAAAVKALEAENKKKLDDKKKGNGSKTASTPPNPNPAAEFKDGKPVFGSKGTPPASESRSLFDTATDQADAVEQPAEDEETTAPPQHPSASASSYPD